MENYKRENTDEITCPHCDYEFYESYEHIPSGEDGEIFWEAKCDECKKEFNISFDSRNIDYGFTSSVIECNEEDHDYEIHDKSFKSKYKHKDEISIYSRYEVCKICGHYKFTPVKQDGSDFSKEELLQHKIKIRAKNKDRKYNQFDGEKSGKFKIEDTEITLKFKEPEGNIKIWVKLCRWMRSKGFTTQKLPDYLRNLNVSFKKGWIECEVSVVNYAITILFYQNQVLKEREKGKGRYEWDKYDILTNRMKLKIRASLFSVKKYLISEGFTFIPELSNTEKLLQKLKVSDLSDWKDPKPGMYRDLEDRDKKILKSGQLKYFYDRKVLKKGVIWWNNGNQWYALWNDKLYYCSHFDLFDYQGEPKRKPLTKDRQIQRLHSELKRAESTHNYDKCKAIWKLIKSYKLYNVWSIKHQAWWGGNNAGYTKDRNLAGVYTHENIIKKSDYYNDGVDSKAILLNSKL